MTDIDERVVEPTTGPDVWRRFAEEHQAEQAVDESRPPESARRRFLRRLRRQPLALIAMIFMAIIVLIAIFAPLIAPFDPDDNNLRDVLKGPSGDHWLGTDQNGRDTLSRLIFGARVSLLAAGQAVGIALLLGLIPGLLAGYFGRWVDAVIMRFAEAIMTFPPLLLAMAIVGVLGPGLTKAMFAVGIVFAPRFARLVRGLVLSVREETYIEASHSIGTSTPRILRRHVLPNILSPLIVQISLALGFSMLAEAALSFLGLGVIPPQSSWGSMLQNAYTSLSTSKFQAIPPGVAIMLTVLAFNLIGDGIRDSLGREIRKGD
jgi:ABC-type dipeptide/oligopeptide/nickel transport system permease subunit